LQEVFLMLISRILSHQSTKVQEENYILKIEIVVLRPQHQFIPHQIAAGAYLVRDMWVGV